MSTTQAAVDVNARIRAAIIAANYAHNGALFGSFGVKVATNDDFTDFWWNERGDQQIAFFQFKGRADGYLPFGDTAVNSWYRGPSQDGALLFASSEPGLLLHPVGMQWILDDNGSHNTRGVSYYYPVPPDGYSSLGICFSPGAAPNVNNYWCVRTDHLLDIQKAGYWSDNGQHWRHNGNLYRPVLSDDQLSQPTEDFLIVPTTFFSAEGPNMQAKALVTKPLYLPVEKVSPISPVFDESAGDGSKTPAGLDRVAVLPYTGIADNNLQNKPVNSPFYYLACEPFYQCLESITPVAGGKIEITKKIGTSKTESVTFRKSTSISVSASVGINVDGLSAGVSTTYTNEFGIEKTSSDTNVTETTETISLNTPTDKPTQLWQKSKRMVLYRTDGAEVTSAVYKLRDLLMKASK